MPRGRPLGNESRPLFQPPRASLIPTRIAASWTGQRDAATVGAHGDTRLAQRALAPRARGGAPGVLGGAAGGRDDVAHRARHGDAPAAASADARVGARLPTARSSG